MSEVVRMNNDTQNPQIDISKIVIGGGLGGALVAAATVLIILLGLPELGYFLGGAVAFGSAIALVLRLARSRTSAAPRGTSLHLLTR